MKDNPVEARVAIPEDVMQIARDVAADLDDIHFNSRSPNWIDDAREIVARAIVADRNRSASPVQAGIDPLVKKAIKQLWPNSLLGPKNLTELIVFIEEERECEAEYRRSQAERIAALEGWQTSCKEWKALALKHEDARTAAESLLAEAREALETAKQHIITLGGNPHPHDTHADQIQVAVLASIDATLSRLKPGEKGGE